MKRNRILTALAAVAIALSLASCSDMLWGVGTDISTGVDNYGPYYGYNGTIWNNALNGFYGPLWTTPPPRPPYRPGWNSWNGGNPGPVIRPGGANRPVAVPSRPVTVPGGVTGQPITPATQPDGAPRPGNNGRP